MTARRMVMQDAKRVPRLQICHAPAGFEHDNHSGNGSVLVLNVGPLQGTVSRDPELDFCCPRVNKKSDSHRLAPNIHIIFGCFCIYINPVKLSKWQKIANLRADVCRCFAQRKVRISYFYLLKSNH